MSTTLVQPIIYKGLRGDSHKFAMTQTRVEYVNKKLIEILKTLTLPSHYKFIDLGQFSKVGQNDPREKFDMRHLGVTSNRKLLNFLLCHAFTDDLKQL